MIQKIRPKKATNSAHRQHLPRIVTTIQQAAFYNSFTSR